MYSQSLLERLKQAIIAGQEEDAAALARQGLAAAVAPLEMITAAMSPGLQAVGAAFGCGEAFLPELLLAANAMKAGLEVLEPALSEAEQAGRRAGTMLLGTVAGDVHTIGKDIVAALCRADGFTVIDAGVDVPPEQFVALVQEHRPDLLGLSALMTTTMLQQRVVIERLQAAGLRRQLKIMVGGAPVTAEWAAEIGADGYAGDAPAAVALCRRLAVLLAPQP